MLATGHRGREGDLVVVWVRGEPGVIRYGLVAGKRIGRAVLRNRAKRRLRQAVMAAGLVPGFDYVLLAGDSTPTVDFETLVSWVRQSCRNIPRADEDSDK